MAPHLDLAAASRQGVDSIPRLMDAQGSRLLLRLLEHIDIQLLHNVDHQVQAVHERVDGHAEHAVRCRAVRDAQEAVVCGVLAWCSCCGKLSANERRKLLVDGNGTQCDRGEARRGEGDVDGPGRGGALSALVRRRVFVVGLADLQRAGELSLQGGLRHGCDDLRKLATRKMLSISVLDHAAEKARV